MPNTFTEKVSDTKRKYIDETMEALKKVEDATGTDFSDVQERLKAIRPKP